MQKVFGVQNAYEEKVPREMPFQLRPAFNPTLFHIFTTSSYPIVRWYLTYRALYCIYDLPDSQAFRCTPCAR